MEILHEPKGEAYVKLVAMAGVHCASCSLMWREDLGMSAAAEAVASTLAPWLVEEARTREWPGTRMAGPPALLRRYVLTPEVLAVLTEASGLYAWQVPDRPEDLAFYDASGEVWLGSVAHERMAFFGPAAPPLAVLRSWLPSLTIRDGGDRRHSRHR